MTNPYTSVSVSADYNANPPADDGTKTVANSITWAKHKTKLSDPLKTAIESVNSNVSAAFLLMFGSVTTTKTSDYPVVAADRGKVFAVSGTTTITALAAATAGDGFMNSVVNSDASTVVTVTGSGSETIGGESNIFLFPGESIIWICDGTNNIIVSDSRSKQPKGSFLYGTFTAADPGYLLCAGETIGDTASGADYEGPYLETVFDRVKAFSPNAGTEDFSAGDTVTLPDLRSLVVAGNDNLGGSSANVITAGNADTPGGIVGTETQAAAGSVGTTGGTTLTLSQIPSHSHSIQGDTGAGAGNIPEEGGGGSSVALGSTGTSGGGSPHTHSGGTFTGSATNIVQPTYCCGAQIKI